MSEDKLESLIRVKVGTRRAFFVEEVFAPSTHTGFEGQPRNLHVQCAGVKHVSFHEGDLPRGFRGIVVAECTHSRPDWISIWKVVTEDD